MLVSRNGAAMTPGRPGPRLGGHRRPRQLRRPVRAERRAAPRSGVVSSPGQGGAAPRPRRRGGHRPQGGRLPVLEGRAHPGRVRVAPARQGHPRPGRRRPRHRLRAPGPPDHGRLGLRLQAGRHRRHLRGHLGLHDRVRQPPPLDEAQDHQGLATSPTTARPGTPTSWSARARSCRRSRPSTPSSEVGEAAYQVHRNLHEGKIGVLCLAPEEGLGHRRPRAAGRGGRGPASPCSGGTGHERAPMTAPASPRSTTWPSPSTTSTPPSPTTRETFGADGRPPRAGRVRRGRGGAAQGGRLLHPAAHPDPRRLAGGQVPRASGARASTTSATGWPTAPPPSQAVKDAGGPGHRRGAPARVAGDDRRLRPPEGGLRHPDRARPGVAGRRPAAPEPPSAAVRW